MAALINGSPRPLEATQDAVEQVLPPSAMAKVDNDESLSQDPRATSTHTSPHHQHSRSQPFVSSADVYAAAQGALPKKTISAKSLAHSTDSSLEFLAGQDELRTSGNPYGFGTTTPTSMSTNTKRASILSFQTALSGSVANYLSADDSASGSARSSPVHRSKPLPATSAESNTASAYFNNRGTDGAAPDRALGPSNGHAEREPVLHTHADEAITDGIPASDTLQTIHNPAPSTHSGLTTVQTEDSLQSAIPDFPPPVGAELPTQGFDAQIKSDDESPEQTVGLDRSHDGNGTIRRPQQQRGQPSLASYAEALTPREEAQLDSSEVATQALSGSAVALGTPSAPVSDFRARPLAQLESPSDVLARQPTTPVAAALQPKGAFVDGSKSTSASPDSTPREPSPPPEGEVEARAEWERAQLLRSKMGSPTMGFSSSSNTMTGRDRDSLRDSFRESLMNGGSPASTASPRGSRGKLNLRPLHLVNAVAAGTSAMDSFNNSSSSGAPGSVPGSPRAASAGGTLTNDNGANRRGSGLWSGPGSPPFNPMRVPGNRSSVNYYVDSAGNALANGGSASDAAAYRARQRASLQLQSPVSQSTSTNLVGPVGTGSAAAAALAQLGTSTASPGGVSDSPSVIEEESGVATPSQLGISNPLATNSLPTPTPGGASSHATAQQHTTLTAEQVRALAAEQLASMPVATDAAAVAAVGADTTPSEARATDGSAQQAIVEPPTVVPAQAGEARSRAGTVVDNATTATAQPADIPDAGQPGPVPAPDTTSPPSHANISTQQLQKQHQREQRRSASGVLAPGSEIEAPGSSGGPYPVFPSPQAGSRASVPAGQGALSDRLAASSAALQAAIEQVQFLQQQAVAGVGTRPPAEIATMAAQAQALANQQAVLTAAQLGKPRDPKSYPGVQAQPSLVPPFELQHRPDGLPSAMIGPDGVRKSLNDPEVCLECMMRDEDMIDVHVNAAAFWERESDALFEEGCLMEREDEERRKSLVTPASASVERGEGATQDSTAVNSANDGGDTAVTNTTAAGGATEDGASSVGGQSNSTKVEPTSPSVGFGVTHVVGQTGISISPRDAMGMVRIGGSRMRVKRIAKGDPLTTERLKLHTQMNPPASSHRWRALQNFLATQAKYIAMEQRARYEAAALAEREAVASGQAIANVQYDNKIIRGATVADAKARQANGIYVEDVNLDPKEQEQKARDIAKAQELRKRASQRASVLLDPELAPRLNQQLPALPLDPSASGGVTSKFDSVASRRASVPTLAEPAHVVSGMETPKQGAATNSPSNGVASRVARSAAQSVAAASPLFSNGDDRMAHGTLSPGSPLGPSTPGIGPHGQPLGSPMSVNRSAYGFPDGPGGDRTTQSDIRSSPSPITKNDASLRDERRASLATGDESISKGRGKGLKKLFSKVAGNGADAESLRSGSLDKQTSIDADEPERNRSSQVIGKSRESADAVAPRFASIVNDGQKRSASALGFSSPYEARSPDLDGAEKSPALELPPGGYYNDPALVASQTSLDIGPFQNPVPPPRIESKTTSSQRKKALPSAPDGSPAADDVVAELASRPGRPARNSQAGATPALARNSSDTANATSSPKANGNGSAFGSRLSTQSFGSATLEVARKSVSSLRNSPATTTAPNQSTHFASTTPSMASLREVADDGSSASRAQFGASPVPSRTRNRSGSNSRNSDFLKPSEQRNTPRKRSFFFRRSKVQNAPIEQDDDLAPRNMPARPMTSMGLHGEGSGLGRAREEKAASRFQRLLGGLFGTSSRKKRTSLTSGRPGSDFDPFNRAGASSRASGFLRSGGLSLPRILRSRASNSNMDKPVTLEKGISNHDPLPNLNGFSGARDERGLPVRAQSAMGRLPSQKFATSTPSFGRPTWASPRSFDEDDEDAADAEMRPDPLASKRKGLGGSRNKLGHSGGGGSQDLLRSPNQFGGSTSSIATSLTQYGNAGGPGASGANAPRLPMRQSSRGSNMKASINLSLPGVHEV